MTKVRKIMVVVGLGVAAVADARPAAAAGFATQHFGGEQGSVVTTNPTALYYNPAGIGFSEGIHLFLGGDLAVRTANWFHTAPPAAVGDQPDSEVGNSGQAHLSNVFGGPALGATMKLGHFAFGAGLFVPFGGRVNWQSNGGDPNYPLVAGGVQRWHMLDAALTFIQVTAGAAYRIGPLSIGATGSFYNSQVVIDQARTLSGYVDTTNEGRANLNVSGNNGSFGAGAMVEAVPNRLWFGASYQAQPGLGDQILKGTFTLASGPPPFYPQNGNGTTAVAFHEALPDIYRVGARFKATDDVELRLYGDLTRWSVMRQQCVNLQGTDNSCLVHSDGSDATVKQSVVFNLPRNWNDTYGVHLGGSYWVKPEIEIFVGAGFETAAEPDTTLEPGAMDADNVTLAVGGRFFIADYFYLAASYTQIQFLNRTVTDSQLAVVNGQQVSYPTSQQDGNGLYTQWIGVFDLNVEKQF